VLDNLSTHSAGALYQTFPADEARRLLRRIELHYVPKHASWLNMVEIEIGVLATQCLDRRIESYSRLGAEVACRCSKMDSGAIGRGQRGACRRVNSRGSTLIAMMEPAHLREGNNVTGGRRLDGARTWAILAQREMRSGVMMILKISRQDAAQVTLVEDDNVIQTFTADRSDETLGKGFCQGERGAVMTSVMPIARTR
jgi:hypothetical protein